MPTVLGIAILGSGRVARARLRELNERYDTRVAVVASRNFDRAYELAFPIAAAATDEWEEAIARRDVDAVMVCSTNPYHAPMVRASIEAGKPVSVDYPLALSLAEAEGLVELAQSRGVVLHVEHIELLSAWFVTLRDALPRLGQLHHLTWHNLSHRAATPEDWTYDRAHGFSLFQQASLPSRIITCVGQATWIEGEETFLGEQGTRFGRRATRLRFGFGKEGVGEIEDILTSEPETGPSAEFQVTGEQGALVGKQHREVWYANPTGNSFEALPVMPRSGLFAQDIAVFLDTIAGQGRPYAALNHVLETLRFADAAERAVKSGQRIVLSPSTA
ncbi:MAG: Gfo/Idh/MocA family oxidoreductase [Chloracidobacterium sp.]|uniref:Gfo/Idh/MocA family oxidoreductase n=1 Tax=Chloracidobacterium validum TaxID=2821543 RepID=A0ABX8B8S4_9BACT|nr:Gfo/Idh/MocA family oxidoreductase [Chloracidobacterium validum]QUW03337.1 Gfo/Idh/MocA family oxidoreductase [Chloracidobacterium validum]